MCHSFSYPVFFVVGTQVQPDRTLELVYFVHNNFKRSLEQLAFVFESAACLSGTSSISPLVNKATAVPADTESASSAVFGQRDKDYYRWILFLVCTINSFAHDMLPDCHGACMLMLPSEEQCAVAGTTFGVFLTL